jgi:small subunit ribosomal protein S6
MRNYELGIILHPSVEQADVTQAVDKVGQYITTSGGAVTSVNVWGRRQLAYPIRKQREGTYVFLQAQVEPKSVIDLERNLKLDEKVLRYLLTCPDEAS